MYVIYEMRDRLRRWFGQGKLKNAKVRRILLGGLFFALLTVILSSQVSPQRLDVKVGDPSPRDIQAPHDMINPVATERKKKAAADRIPMLTEVDPAVLKGGEEYITYAFNEIQTVRGLANQDQKTRADTLSSRLKLGSAVPPETYAALLTSTDQVLAVARQDALDLVRAALSGSVKQTDVADLQTQIDKETAGFTLITRDTVMNRFVKELVKSQIKSNVVENRTATEDLRKKAYQAEDPVWWKQNQLIAKKGEIVTDEQYAMLEELRLVGPRADFRSLIGTALLSLVLVSLMGLYLIRYRRDLLEKDSKILLLGLIGILTLLLSLLMKAFDNRLGVSVAYLMPVAVNSVLVTILLDAKAALLQSAILAVLVGFISGGDQVTHAMVALVGATVGVYSVARVESRTDIYRSGLLVSGANVAAILAFYLIQAASLLDTQLWIDVGLGFANGLVVAVLVTGALPFFENIFGVVTPLKLLELSNPNHPLLKKLLVEAPGSYHHTILVANLCEAAAEAIGADQVLARVGAYYHDIGKTKRPYFFVENQFGGENPHDKLPPSLSALIITSHVKDGLEMAKEARLPQEILDFIPTHHGTTLVSYFYYLASKNGQSEYVLEDDFRYDGPKPHTKEQAVLMLADGCEASVRAMRQKGHLTMDQIEAQVKRIMEDRLRQGQLDNCDLTLRELDTIARTFVKVLGGVHHARIEYPPEAQGRLPAPAQLPPGQPETAPEESGGEKQSGDLDQQRAGTAEGEPGAGGDGAPGGDGRTEGGGDGARG
jgi:cyclic-di-AMP phosphodiesterase PgpH